MRAYIIRFNHPVHSSVSGEVVAGTEIDARSDFEGCYPECEIIGSYAKPFKQQNDK
jgi:hypothetical protein